MWVCFCGVFLERKGVGRQEGLLKENMLVGLHLLILLFSISFSGIAIKSKSALMELPVAQSWEHFSVWVWKSSRHQEKKRAVCTDRAVMQKATGVCGLAENSEVSSCQKNRILKQTLFKGSGGKLFLRLRL